LIWLGARACGHVNLEPYLSPGYPARIVSSGDKDETTHVEEPTQVDETTEVPPPRLAAPLRPNDPEPITIDSGSIAVPPALLPEPSESITFVARPPSAEPAPLEPITDVSAPTTVDHGPAAPLDPITLDAVVAPSLADVSPAPPTLPPPRPQAAAPASSTPTDRHPRFTAVRSNLSETSLRQEEIDSGRTFVRLLIAVIALSGIMLLLIDGDRVAETVTVFGLLYTVIAFAWFLYRVRDAGSYHVGQLLFLIVSTLLASHTTIYLWGVISPMPVIFSLCIGFVGHSIHPTIALSGYLTCTVAQLGLAILTGTGVLRDRALIPLDSLGPGEIIVSQIVVHSMYLCGFLVARYNRRMAQQTLQQLERAAVEVARRDLLLQEARQELSNALRVGAAGRYTGQVMGRFRLGVLLGHGAVGEVYEAADLEGGSVAAVKLLHGDTAEELQVQRFLREAEHASALRSPHVVRVFDYGSAPDGAHYLAMERLQGSNLAEHLRVYERMSLPEVVTLVEHVGAGLQAAWEAGIVHRDVKPQNLFRCYVPHGPPVWKILDFGASRMAHHAGTLTQGNIIGTPSYMAPEQVESKTLDHRADLFALAAVAYRALTGRPAFGGSKLPIVLYRVVYAMPDAPSSAVVLPADVDLVFARALAKQPEDRFAGTVEFAQALALAARGKLSEKERREAHALLRKHPWGTLMRPAQPRPRTVTGEAPPPLEPTRPMGQAPI
jgi:serine/threonine-protein kinase